MLLHASKPGEHFSGAMWQAERYTARLLRGDCGALSTVEYHARMSSPVASPVASPAVSCASAVPVPVHARLLACSLLTLFSGDANQGGWQLVIGRLGSGGIIKTTSFFCK